MKLSNFPLVMRAVEARDALVMQILNGTVIVTIDGVRQDSEIIERVKPVVRAVLEERIGELNADLMGLGVDIEADAARSAT